jgi:hypothetical protein
MNTLSRAITARFFPDKDSYNAFRKHWSALINSSRRHDLTAAHHLLYLGLTGKDWRRAFTPLTNRRKLDNGAFFGWGLFRALRPEYFGVADAALLAPWDGLITPRMLEELRKLLPRITQFTCKAEQFAGGRYPFDAYEEEAAAGQPEEAVHE